jgi:DUF1680 family protein
MQWAWRMFLATGEATFLDVFERVLYNAFAVGVSEDGRKFFYDNPLQRRPDHDQRSGAETGGDLLRRPWFGCACCPPNIVRWIAQLAGHIAVEQAGGLLIALYTPARIRSGPMSLAMDTDYPWDGEVRLTVERAPGEPYAITLRVPEWTGTTDEGALEALSLRVNGEPVNDGTVNHGSVNGDSGHVRVRDGFVTLERRWRTGDEVRLELPMEARLHGSHPAVDATRGAVALARGPVVYCVEQHDCDAGLDELRLGPAMFAAHPPRAVRDPGIAHAPGSVVLEVTGEAATDEPPAALYPRLTSGSAADREPAALPVRATFIPYHQWGNRAAAAMRVWVRRG